MIIIKNLLIIYHLIFVSVTLPYLPLIIQDTSPYFIQTEQVDFTTQYCV